MPGWSSGLANTTRRWRPGLNIVIPFIDRIAYKHILKEIPLDVPPQVCITRDNTQLQVDGILYFQITDAMRASYGSSNYIAAITQLAQTTLRSVIGKMELDKTFEERDHINTTIVNAIDESAANWGVKVLRYEIKDLTPPAEILHAMQAPDHRRARKARADRRLRRPQAGTDQHRQRRTRSGDRPLGRREAGRDQPRRGRGGGHRRAGRSECRRRCARSARRSASRAARTRSTCAWPSNTSDAFGKLAKTNNSIIVPANMGDVSGLIASAMQIVKTQR